MSDTLSRTVVVDGFATHLLEAGDPEAENLVLLHGCGLGSTSADWHSFIPRLSAHYHVIAPDLAGCGGSQYGDEQAGMGAWVRTCVRQVLGVMRELSIDEAHLVGYALSGSIALQLLIGAPDRFGKASLVSSTGGRPEVTPELRALLGFYEDPSITALADIAAWGVYDEDGLDRPFADIVCERYAEALRPEVRGVLERCFTSPGASEHLVVPPAALRRITHDVLVVHGRDDHFVTPAAAIDLQRRLPNAELHIYPKTGHWVVAERGAQYARLLRDFLNPAPLTSSLPV